MTQQDVDDIIVFCPTCGNLMQNLTLRWGKTCSRGHGDIYVKEANETVAQVTLEMRLVVPITASDR